MIASLIAIPLCFILMHNWLQNFAYCTSISWWTFGIAAVLAT
ncbi:hypothetical protein ADIARSV_0895 [Arcticibacter svalbardensis MN12-7]|uniref:Uncharacterized protein n=1 Tax=Arcticibacter svalbardensis MN12-7 TaxID=1150600 RepID=R9GVP4_9SPHI|nr:hypothetical protein ADIARSV_0895 [Arcticibacter svalbardensis MN12-7]